MRQPRDGAAQQIRGLRDRGERLAAAISRARDPEQAFAEATLLVETAREIAGQAALARARAAARIADDEHLTVRHLGARLGVSYARAHQLLAIARSDAPPEGE